MKKLTIYLFFILSAITSYGQLTINTIVTPPYSPYYEDYLQYDNKVVITIQNNSNQDYEFYFRGRLTSDNGIEIVTKSAYRPSSPYFIAAHQMLQLSGGDLEPYLSFDNVDISGIDISDIIGSEGLPEGNYQICVQAKDWLNNQDLSAIFPMGCSPNILIEHIEPSSIINPVCGSTINPSNVQNIVFSWLISPGALPNTEYVLQIVNVEDEQSPESAMASMIDPVFFEKTVKGYSYLYGPSDPQLTIGKEYAVRVRSIDPSGKKIYRNNGYGEVCSFVYGNKDTLKTGITITTPIDNINLDEIYKNLNNTSISGKLLCKIPHKKTINFSGLNFPLNDNSSPNPISDNGADFSNFNFNAGQSFNNNNLTQGIYTNEFVQGLVPSQGNLPNNFSHYIEFDKESPQGAIPLTNTRIRLVPTYFLESTISNKNQIIIDPEFVLLKNGQMLILPKLDNFAKISMTTDANGLFSTSFYLAQPMGFVTDIDSWSNQNGLDGATLNTGGPSRVMIGYAIKIDDDRFLAPNLLAYPHPGDEIKLPDQVSLIKAYQADIIVEPDLDMKYIFSDNGVLSNVDVTIYREQKDIESEKPEILQLEGQQLSDYERIEGKRLKVVSKAKTDSKGSIKFDKLVPLKGNSSYIIEIKTRNKNKKANGYESTAKFNYYTIRGRLDDESFLKKENDDLHGALRGFSFIRDEIKWSSNYKIPIYQFRYGMNSRRPEIKGRVREKGNDVNPINIPGLNNVKVTLYSLHKNGPTTLKHITTHADGWFRFTNLPVDTDKGMTDGPLRFLQFQKNGYNTIFRPKDINDINKMFKLSYGEFMFLGDIDMYPQAQVRGIVEDEDGKAVESYVSVVDGAYYKTKGNWMQSSSGLWNYHQMFKMNVPWGNQIFIAQPLSTEYYWGLKSKTIPKKATSSRGSKYLDIGKIIVMKKLHRLRVVVMDYSGKKINARVKLGEESKITQNGVVDFKFASQAEDFILSIYPNNKKLIEYHEVIHLPNSASASTKQIKLDRGASLKGIVKDRTTQLPIAGAVVSILESTTNGIDNYKSATTDNNGQWKINGIRLDMYGWLTIDVHKDKTPAGVVYMAKQKAIDTSHPDADYISIYLNRMKKPVEDIWGFPIVVNSYEQQSGGKVKISGYIHHPPTATCISLQNPDQRIYFSKTDFKADLNGKLVPISNAVKIVNNNLKIKINDFYVNLFASSHDGGNPELYLRKQKNDNTGAIVGLMSVESKSFKSSYAYHGQLFLSEKGNKFVTAFSSSNANNYIDANTKRFGVFQFSFSNRWKHNIPSDISDFSIFGFDATASKEDSYLLSDKIHLKATVHTNIKNCTPSDLNLKLGEIIITSTSSSFVKGNSEKLTFKLDNWDVYDKGGWTFDKNESAFILKEALIVTHKGMDFKVKGMRIKKDELAEGDISSKDGLTLGGVIDLHLNSNAPIRFFYDPYSSGGQYIITATSTNNSSAAYTDDLPGITGKDKKLRFENVTIPSKDSISLGVSMTTKYMNIVDFNLQRVITGSGFLDLVGRPDLNIPNLSVPTVTLRYTKTGNTVKHKLMPLKTYVPTLGGVEFILDPAKNMQHTTASKFTSYGDFTIKPHGGSTDGGLIQLRGLLTKTPTTCTIEVIDVDPSKKVKGTNHQLFPSGNDSTSLIIIQGKQEVTNTKWDTLRLAAKSDNNEGIAGNNFDFTVYGSIGVSSNKIETSNDIGIGKLSMIYNWSDQSLEGALKIRVPVTCGPVILSSGGTGFCRFDGGGFYMGYNGGVQISGFEITTASLLLGWNDQVTTGHKNLAIGYFVNKQLLEKTEIMAKSSVHGIFVGLQKNFLDERFSFPIITPPGLFTTTLKLGMEGFLSANFKNLDMQLGGSAFASGSVRYETVIIDPYCVLAAKAQIDFLGAYRNNNMTIDSKGSLRLKVMMLDAGGCVSFHLGTSDPQFDFGVNFDGSCGNDSSANKSCD